MKNSAPSSARSGCCSARRSDGSGRADGRERGPIARRPRPAASISQRTCSESSRAGRECARQNERSPALAAFGGLGGGATQAARLRAGLRNQPGSKALVPPRTQTRGLSLRRPQRAVGPVARRRIVQGVSIAIGTDVAQPPVGKIVGHGHHRLAASRARLPDRIKHSHRIFPRDDMLMPRTFSAQVSPLSNSPAARVLTRSASAYSTLWISDVAGVRHGAAGVLPRSGAARARPGRKGRSLHQKAFAEAGRAIRRDPGPARPDA